MRSDVFTLIPCDHRRLRRLDNRGQAAYRHAGAMLSMNPRLVFTRFLPALFILAFTLSAADAPKQAIKADGGAKSPDRYEAAIRKFEAADAAQMPQKGAVLLIGGSNAVRWKDVGDYFPGQPVINRGFGGALLADVLHFADRIVLPYAPRVIVLNAGFNDLIAGKSPEDVRDTCRAFVKKVGAALPQTRIIAISLPPVLSATNPPESLAMVKKTNAPLSALADEEPSLEFVDLFPAFADAGGKTRAELFLEDGMHFMRAGLRHRRGSAEARLVLSHESRQLPSWLICNGRHKSHG